MSDDDSETDRERKVRFHGRVQFKTIRHVADFSEEEIMSGWYRKKDFMRMSEEVSEIAQLVAQGKESHNGEELSIRGLEHLVEEDVADYRAEKMIASIDAVLDEQDEQRDEDIDDPVVIATIYAEIVAPLLREAYLVGLRDAKDGAAAAEQIPDLSLQDISNDANLNGSTKSNSSDSDGTSSTSDTCEVTSTPEEGEELLHETSTELLNDVNDDKSNNPGVGQGAAQANNGSKSANSAAQPKKASPAKRKNRTRIGFGTESSPLVRRRDGTFAFRNKDAESAQAEVSKQRRDCVRDALFKHLDDEEEISISSLLASSSR